MVEQKYTWTKPQLRIAVAKALCRRDVARILCPEANPAVLNKRLARDIARMKLDTSHWRGSAQSGVKRRRSEQNLFKKNSSTDRATIRRRILRANLLPYRCAICDEYQWNGKPLSLHVDHINGERTDNRLSNLRLLCPNCHTQTSTYAGKRSNHLTNRAMGDILHAIAETHGQRIADQLREDI